MEGWNKKKIIIAVTLVIVLVAIIAIFVLIGGLGEKGVVVEFNSSGSWVGTISDDSGYNTVSGTGRQTFRVSDQGSITVVGTLMSTSGSLTIKIIDNGNVVAEKTTNMPYFPLMVSATV